jgi:DNA-binding response OmpR family regulator
MLRTLLLPRAGRVESVASIDDAIACLARGEITRIVIDDQVVRARVEPSVDSHAELRRLTAAAAAYGVHVALLWPVTAEQEHAELLATGIDQVVAKPITGAALVAALFCTPTVRLVDHRLVPQAA